jgi:DNA-directed RNA polymerase I and III subunit RPAC2
MAQLSGSLGAASSRRSPSILFLPRQLEYTDEQSRTFVFGDEDHTLGNSLRHVLMGRKETTFCGYSVPHPSEPKMNVRLQTSSSKPAVQVLKDGLHEMVEICDLFDFTLDSAIAEYEAREKEASAEGEKSDSN